MRNFNIPIIFVPWQCGAIVHRFSSTVRIIFVRKWDYWWNRTYLQSKTIISNAFSNPIAPFYSDQSKILALFVGNTYVRIVLQISQKHHFFLLLCCSSYVYSFNIETQLNKFIFSAWENSPPYTRLCVCVRPKLNPLCKNWITSLCVLKYKSVHRDIFVIILSFFNTSMFSLSHLQRSPIRRKKTNSLSINIDILFYFCQRSSVNVSLRIFFFIHFDWIFI